MFDLCKGRRSKYMTKSQWTYLYKLVLNLQRWIKLKLLGFFLPRNADAWIFFLVQQSEKPNLCLIIRIFLNGTKEFRENMHRMCR